VDSWALWLPNSGMWSINQTKSASSSAIDVHQIMFNQLGQGVAPCFCGAASPRHHTTTPHQSEATGGMPTGTAMG